MDKQSKDKKNTPKTQGRHKTSQRTGNEADVKGELAIRGKTVRGHQQKPNEPNKSH